MKIAVFFGNVISASAESGMSIPGLLELFRKSGAEGLEICVGEYNKYKNELDEAVRNGFEISSVYNEYRFQNGELDPDEVIRHIHCAARLGCPKILIIPGFYTDLENRELCEKEKDSFRVCIGTICRMARDTGITPLLEDYDHFLSPVCHMTDVLWFAERIPGLSVTFDAGNLIYAGETEFDAMAGIESLERRLGRQLIANVHCKDRTPSDKGYGRFTALDGREFCPEVLGEGCIDYRWLVGKLRERSYNGYLVVENFAVKGYVDFMLRSIKNISELIG